MAGWYSAWRFAERKKVGPAPYELSNYYAKKYGAPNAQTMLEILGLYGQLSMGSKICGLGRKAGAIMEGDPKPSRGRLPLKSLRLFWPSGVWVAPDSGSMMKAIGDEVMKK